MTISITPTIRMITATTTVDSTGALKIGTNKSNRPRITKKKSASFSESFWVHSIVTAAIRIITAASTYRQIDVRRVNDVCVDQQDHPDCSREEPKADHLEDMCRRHDNRKSGFSFMVSKIIDVAVALGILVTALGTVGLPLVLLIFTVGGVLIGYVFSSTLGWLSQWFFPLIFAGTGLIALLILSKQGAKLALDRRCDIRWTPDTSATFWQLARSHRQAIILHCFRLLENPLWRSQSVRPWPSSFSRLLRRFSISRWLSSCSREQTSSTLGEDKWRVLKHTSHFF